MAEQSEALRFCAPALSSTQADYRFASTLIPSRLYGGLDSQGSRPVFLPMPALCLFTQHAEKIMSSSMWAIRKKNKKLLEAPILKLECQYASPGELVQTDSDGLFLAFLLQSACSEARECIICYKEAPQIFLMHMVKGLLLKNHC